MENEYFKKTSLYLWWLSLKIEARVAWLQYWYNYNRYAYCLINPLIYSDPTGEKWNWSFLNPVYWLNEGVQWINDKTPELRKKMTEIGVPDFNVGYNSSQGSFHSFGDNGNFYHRNQFDPGINAIKAVEEMRTIDATANGGGGYWNDGVSLSISGAYASPFKATGSRGFSFGYFRGAEDGGFYFTAKKGRGVMMSLSIDGSYYINNTSSNLQVKHLFSHGEEWDVGYSDVGAAFSAGSSKHGTPYYCITGSYSPGLDYGGAEWVTYTVPILIKGTGGIYSY